jgi:hypothetical protein
VNDWALGWVDREEVRVTHCADAPLIDPRCGDAEDDVASTKQRSLFAIAGSLLAEISVTKLLLAWTVSILLPGILLGLAPLLATAWFASVSTKIASLTELGTGLVLLAIITLGWVGWRPLFRTAENNFWSLNALAVQPATRFAARACAIFPSKYLRAIQALLNGHVYVR